MRGGVKIVGYKNIVLKREDSNIVNLILQRPEVKNALNRELVQELIRIIEELEMDEGVNCIILSGKAGNFVAGADINEMVGANPSNAYEFAQEMKMLHDKIIHCSMPVIAVLEGYCLGGGLELALACDIRLVNQSTRIGLPEINLGIIPGGGGIQRLLDIVGVSTASKMIMTGEIINGREASELNIGSYVETDIYEAALNIAEQISKNSKPAISSIKRLINQCKLQQSSAELKEEIFEFSLLFDHPDSLEGMSAFLQKRKPLFQRKG